ncbi:MAG: hypothetical protein HQM00_04330 [Magnetococcales bacterium]|nr:hypothetical protein [Magnetococcales bacterium]
MESIEVGKIKPGQIVTLEFGNKSPILTKLEAPGQFSMEDWYPEPCDIYILDEEIAEDEPLHYSFDASVTLDDLEADQKLFGEQRKIHDFLGRVVGSIEMEEDEDEDSDDDSDDDGDGD